MIVLSATAGMVTLVLVAGGRFGPARASAALAIVAIIAGWAVAQEPEFLPALTVSHAAAGRSTLIPIIVAVAAGAVVLVPSLVLLFTLFCAGASTGTRGLPYPSPQCRRRAASGHPSSTRYSAASLLRSSSETG